MRLSTPFRLWLLAVAFIILAMPVYAGHEKSSARLQGAGFIPGATMTALDTKYSTILASLMTFKEAGSTTTVRLGVNHYSPVYTAAYNLTVRVKISYLQYTGGSSFSPQSVTQDLMVVYDPTTSTAVFPDLNACVLQGGYSVQVKIVGIKDNITSTLLSVAPGNLYIETEIDAERYYDLDYVSQPYNGGFLGNLTATALTASDEIEVDWQTIPGAEEYELEWVWVSSDINPAYPFVIDFKNNSTRIRTSDHFYRISNVFEKGIVFFRIRGVGRYDINKNNKFEAEYYTLWTWNDVSSYSLPLGVSTLFPDGFIGALFSCAAPRLMYVDGSAILNPHESLKDWQYNATYAEEGKKKEVVSYFDGSLRNRQTVTKNNSDNNSIVGETYYDYNGRGAIQSLPVPVSNSTIKFYEYNKSSSWAFNYKDGSSTPYDKSIFDVDPSPLTSGNCPISPPPMDSTTGATHYYSQTNPDQTKQQAYVADSRHYPFVQTEYTPDKTGRIRRQSNAGSGLHLGTGHETKYFYGSPAAQDELDIMFGSEVGDYRHYKKNMVVDPNGQVSISYLDMQGRTIATALAGPNPANLKALNTTYPLTSISADLLNKASSGDPDTDVDNNILKQGGTQLSFYKDILVTETGNYTFNYDMTGTAFSFVCSETPVCYDCVYDLTINVIDECGYSAPLVSGGPLPVTKIVGNLTFNVDGSPAFDTDCDPSTPYNSGSIVASLQPGSYSVIKTLSINKDALNYYLDQYIKNNTCIKKESDFINPLVATADVSGCNIDCDACVAALGNRNDFITNGLGTGDEWDELFRECREPCNYTNTCESTYISLLADMSPGGQYAEWDDGTGCNPGAFPVSILNGNNMLVHTGSSGIQRAVWNNPNLSYKNDDGSASYITVTKLSSGAYLPAVNASVTPSPLGGNTYQIKPQDLDDVCEFKNRWQNSWAKELVRYHPEYAYYDWCIKNSSDIINSNNWQITVTPPSSSPNTVWVNSSKDYDSLMLITDDLSTVSTGDLDRLVNPLDINYSSYALGNPNDQYFREPNSTWYTTTPFSSSKTGSGPGNTAPWAQYNTSFGPYKSAASRFINYKGSGLDLWHFAYAIASGCATEFGTTITSSDPCFASYPASPVGFNNATWAKFKMLYQSLKQELMNEAAQSYALNGVDPTNTSNTYNRCNDCIGNGGFSFLQVPFGTFQMFFPTSSNWITNWFIVPNYAQQAPCGMVLSQYYKNKIKRFPSMQDVTGLQAGTNASIYQLTGKCPAANDYEAILNALAKTGDISAAGPVQLNTYPEFTKVLYDMIQPSAITYPGLNWNTSTSLSGFQLDIVIKDGSTSLCNARINWDAINYPATLWSSTITRIYDLVFTGYSAGISSFTAKATVQTGISTFQDYPITGTICGNLGDCNFDPVCTANDNANAVRNLFDMLAQEGQLCSTSINLTAAPYNSLFTNTFGQFLSSGTWNWNLSGSAGSISCGSCSDNLSVTFTSGLTLLCSEMGTGNPNSVAIVSVLPVSGPSAVPGDFTMNYTYISGGIQYAATVTGHIDYNNGTSTSGFPLGSCDVDQPVCNTTENKNRDDLEAFFDDASTKGYFTASTTPVDITSDLYFTAQLKNLIYSTPSYNTTTMVMTPVTYYWTLNSSTPSNIFNATICSSTTGSAPTPGNSCCQITFSLNPALGKTQNDIVSLGKLIVVYDPTTSAQAYSFKIVANFGSSFPPDTLYGTSSCFPIRGCEVCDNPTDITAFANCLAPDGFESAISYPIADNTTGSACSSGFTNVSSGTTINLLPCQWGTAPSATFYTGIVTPHSGSKALFVLAGDGSISNDVTVYDNSWAIPSKDACYAFSGWYIRDVKLSCKLELYINGNLIGTQYIPYANSALTYLPPVWTKLIFGGSSWHNSSGATSLHVVIKAKPTPPGFNSGTLSTLFGFDDFSVCQVPCGIKPCVDDMQPDTMPQIAYVNPCQQQALDNAAANGLDQFQNYIDSLKDGFVDAYVKKCMGYAIEHFTMDYGAGQYQYTLYYYDQAGNLVRTVPPAGVSLVTSPTDLANIKTDRAGYPTITKTYYTGHGLYTTYTYNSLNQLTKQITPDAGTSNFWYDALGRMVASQNAEQAASTSPNKYSYTSYDALGRINEVGQVTSPYAPASMSSHVNPGPSFFLSSGSPVKDQVTATFYGDDPLYTTTPVSALPTALTSAQDYIRGRVAAVTIEDTDDSNSATFDHGTFYNYDIHGNVKELVQLNPDMSFVTGQDQKLMQYDYDLISGKVNTVSYQPGQIDQFYHKYEYDADNRITNVYTSKDNILWDQDAKYWYYQHGPLARTEIGDSKSQGFDYAYTLQGWIKGVNSNLLQSAYDIGRDNMQSGTSSYGTLNKWFAKDAFGYNLNYFSQKGTSANLYDYEAIDGSSLLASTSFIGDFYTNLGTTLNTGAPALYNGNISHMVTSYMNNDPSAAIIGGSAGSLAQGQPYALMSAYKYDQLNRIVNAKTFQALNSSSNVWGSATQTAYGEQFTYDANGNISTAKRTGTAPSTFPDMDLLTYNYVANSNKLDYVNDAVASGAYSDDIDAQSSGNYTYDNNGNLIGDVQEEVQNISWSVYGKMKTLTRISTSSRPELTYKYDASGNRVSKRIHIPGNPSTSDDIYFYLRDAQGNVMAVYHQRSLRSAQLLDLEEQHIYGSSRLGILSNVIGLNSPTVPPSVVYRQLGSKSYELSNHLGNVVSVVSDRKIPFETFTGSGIIGSFNSDILSHQTYYAFGANHPGRSYSSSSYRYTFNGKEKDSETNNTSGSTQDYGMRIYNPSLGKFLSIDPFTKKYPFYTPYQFAGNKPIAAKDLDGGEPDYVVDETGKLTYPVLYLLNAITNYNVTMMQQITITKCSDPNPEAYAETYSETDVRTYDKSQSGGNKWLRTLAHEIKHVDQHTKSPFPAAIDRLLFSTELLRGYNSQNNQIEQPARDQGKLMDEFTSKYNPDAVLSDKTMGTYRKFIRLNIMVESFFMEKDQKQLDYYENLMKSAGNADTKNYIQKKIDTFMGNIEKHQAAIDALNDEEKKLDEKKTEN